MIHFSQHHVRNASSLLYLQNTNYLLAIYFFCSTYSIYKIKIIVKKKLNKIFIIYQSTSRINNSCTQLRFQVPTLLFLTSYYLPFKRALILFDLFPWKLMKLRVNIHNTILQLHLITIIQSIIDLLSSNQHGS